MASGARKERDIKEEEGGGRREKAEDIYPVWKEKKRHGNRIFLEGGGPFFHRKHKICMLRMLKLFIFTKKFFRHVHVQQIKCNDLRKERATKSNMAST